MLLSKESFVKTINCVETLKDLYKDYESFVCELLNSSLQLQDGDDTIRYFIHNLDFGKKYYHGCFTDEKTLKNVDISTAEKLYDYLINGALSEYLIIKLNEHDECGRKFLYSDSIKEIVLKVKSAKIFEKFNSIEQILNCKPAGFTAKDGFYTYAEHEKEFGHDATDEYFKDTLWISLPETFKFIRGTFGDYGFINESHDPCNIDYALYVYDISEVKLHNLSEEEATALLSIRHDAFICNINNKNYLVIIDGEPWCF